MLNKETLIESFKTVINNKLTQLVEREYSTVETMTVDEIKSFEEQHPKDLGIDSRIAFAICFENKAFDVADLILDHYKVYFDNERMNKVLQMITKNFVDSLDSNTTQEDIDDEKDKINYLLRHGADLYSQENIWSSPYSLLKKANMLGIVEPKYLKTLSPKVASFY